MVKLTAKMRLLLLMTCLGLELAITSQMLRPHFDPEVGAARIAFVAPDEWEKGEVRVKA